MRKHNTHPLTLVLYGPSRRVMFNVFQDISKVLIARKGSSPSLPLSRFLDSIYIGQHLPFKYSSRCDILGYCKILEQDTGSLKASSFLGFE